MCKVWAISVTILTLEANFKISNNRNSIDQEFCLEFVQQRINSLGSSKKKKKKKKKRKEKNQLGWTRIWILLDQIWLWYMQILAFITHCYNTIIMKAICYGLRQQKILVEISLPFLFLVLLFFIVLGN